MSIYTQVKYKIATECNRPIETIRSGTAFMTNREFSFFNCVDVLADLEHQFGIKLPESDYVKYGTVGRLTRCIVKELKHRTR